MFLSLFIEKKSFTYNFYNADESNFHHFKKDAKKKLLFHSFRVNFLNANENPSVVSKNSFPEYYNYFLGKDPKNWKSNIKSYQLIHYNNLYQNIDLALYSLGDRLKYDVIVNPGGNIKDVMLQYEGHNKLIIDDKGNLHITTSINEIIEQKPLPLRQLLVTPPLLTRRKNTGKNEQQKK